MPQLPHLTPRASVIVTADDPGDIEGSLTDLLAWPEGATKCYAVILNDTASPISIVLSGATGHSARWIPPNTSAPVQYGPLNEESAGLCYLMFEVAGSAILSWDEIVEVVYE